MTHHIPVSQTWDPVSSYDFNCPAHHGKLFNCVTDDGRYYFDTSMVSTAETLVVQLSQSLSNARGPITALQPRASAHRDDMRSNDVAVQQHTPLFIMMPPSVPPQ